MQPTKNCLVPRMLAVGANRQIALDRIFLYELFVQLQRFNYFISFFILSSALLEGLGSFN